ncbi:MAG: hypothetical protein GY789_07985 [Hyphomicrobiales bacterium]|nr:hypothetical protein [Hyphomicrobiales bacterium]MCP4998030.1 hypothetical protein [Hyphomicrobiales bacterium]
MGKKTGDLNLLWQLIEMHASHVQMDDNSFQLFFDTDFILKCPNQGNAPELALVWEGESPEGGILLARYPVDL